jgi:outer membrane biosynthesis protein TonB
MDEGEEFRSSINHEVQQMLVDERLPHNEGQRMDAEEEEKKEDVMEEKKEEKEDEKEDEKEEEKEDEKEEEKEDEKEEEKEEEKDEEKEEEKEEQKEEEKEEEKKEVKDVARQEEDQHEVRQSPPLKPTVSVIAASDHGPFHSNASACGGSSSVGDGRTCDDRERSPVREQSALPAAGQYGLKLPIEEQATTSQLPCLPERQQHHQHHNNDFLHAPNCLGPPPPNISNE